MAIQEKQKKRSRSKRIREALHIKKTSRSTRNRDALRARQRQAARAETRRKREKRPTPAVVYTEPAVFNRNRLILQLLAMTAVVLALVVGMSIFFRVERITITGGNVYSEWTIREASGIEEGDYLLTFSRERASGRIIAELPYVNRVRIGIKLPDTVNIVIEELDVVYSAQDTTGLWWLISSEGKVVEMTDAATAATYTKVLGVNLESPVVGEIAEARENATNPTAQTDAQGQIIGTEPVLVTNGERLEVALQILRELERNDEVGTAASVDVTDTSNIVLWYGTQYEVLLGDSGRLDYKIACMCAAINSPELATGYGVLDVSFIIWDDQVGYTPFA